MPTPQELKATLLANTRVDGTCLRWTGPFPYGNQARMPRIGSKLAVHVASELLDGKPVDTTRVVSLTCEHKWCVNPEHMQLGDVRAKPERTVSMGPEVIEYLQTIDKKLDMLIELVTQRPQTVESVEDIEQMFNSIVLPMTQELPTEHNGIKVFPWAVLNPTHPEMNDDAVTMPFPDIHPLFPASNKSGMFNAICLTCDVGMTIPAGAVGWAQHRCGDWFVPSGA